MDQPQSGPTLSYAPSKRSGDRWIYVLVWGLITTSLALAGSWSVEHYSKGDMTVMGFYIWGIAPVGAFGLGMLAASGYALAAWVVGWRIRAGLLWTILAFTFLAYGGMHYIEFKAQGPLVFKSTGKRVTFLDYFDLTTRAIHFHSMNSTTPDQPDVGASPQPGKKADEGLGSLGYGVRALELGAFSLGALCTPLFLRKKRYCELCERYYSTYRLAVIPACAPAKGMSRLSRKALQQKLNDEENLAAAALAQEAVVGLAQCLTDHDMERFKQMMDPFEKVSKAAKKLARSIALRFSRCKGCGQGVFHPVLITRIDARTVRRKEMFAKAVEPADGDAIRPRRGV